MHPCRNCLDKVFHFGQSLSTVKPVVHGDEGEEEEDDEDDDDHGHSEMSKTKHFVLTMAIVASGFLIALMVDDLQIGTYFLLREFFSDVNLGSSSFVCGSNWVYDDIVYSTRTPFLGGMQTSNKERKMTDLFF